VGGTEQIQDYDLDIGDDIYIVRRWSQEIALTAFLNEYVHRQGIDLVIDVLGSSAYRRMFCWPRITAQTRVLHAYPTKSGDEGLSALGELTRKWLACRDPRVLLALKDGDTVSAGNDTILLSSSTHPNWPPSPGEIEPHSGPRMIPDEFLVGPDASVAETQLFHALKAALSPEYTVYHSISRLVRRGPASPIGGAIDFVITHPGRGALVLEVKGGGINYRHHQRRWVTINRQEPQVGGPFRQVRANTYWLIRELRKRPDLRRGPLPIAHALAFPDVILETDDVGRLDPSPRQIFMDRRDVRDIWDWVDRAMAFHILDPDDMRERTERTVEAIEEICGQGFAFPAVR
jgi:hypothetical protein